MKKILSFVFATSFLYAGLFGLNEWQDGYVFSEETESVALVIYKDNYDGINIGVEFDYVDCQEFSDEIYDTESMSFNGTLVKMYAQCVGQNVRMDFPRTDRGMEYVMNELRTKDKVIVEQDGVIFTFGTKNFENEVEREKVSEEGI